MNNDFLYRGVHVDIHMANDGVLIPKGTSITRVVHLDTSLARLDSGITLDDSTENAVIGHQINSDKFPSSGVSTTPHFNRAKYYATRGHKTKGIVYKIARDKLMIYGITEYIVSEYAVQPKDLSDEEVILVHKDHGPLPSEVVVSIIEVET
ncbi:MAG: hypothetical protein RQ760_18335 [Sedimentisphaerales bacterium]|nr:hypothetical protein [Sedimentisphaerales bacterium]